MAPVRYLDDLAPDDADPEDEDLTPEQVEELHSKQADECAFDRWQARQECDA
jgi:hypothetical protein